MWLNKMNIQNSRPFSSILTISTRNRGKGKYSIHKEKKTHKIIRDENKQGVIRLKWSKI